MHDTHLCRLTSTEPTRYRPNHKTCYDVTRATLSVALYARQMQFKGDQILLLGSKALSKCEVNPTSGFQDIAFTSNKLLWRPSWFS